jgi:DNA-directed RNA polymerase II subunit RPB2
VNNDLDRSIKITSPHRLHSQQWGIICPFESPDGASIGYLKNFAMLTQMSFGTRTQVVVEALRIIDVGADNAPIIKTMSAVSFASLARRDAVKIFLNGGLYGVTIDPLFITQTLRLFRRNGLIHQLTSVAWNIKENEIRIHTDAGRPCRPLFIVDKSTVLADKMALKKHSWSSILVGNSRRTEKDEFISPYTIDHLKDKDFKGILADLETTSGCIEYIDIEDGITLVTVDGIVGNHPAGRFEKYETKIV